MERPSTPPRSRGLKVARWVRLIAARLGYQSRIMAVLCLTARQSPWCLKSAQILAYDVKVSAHPPLGRQPPWHALPCLSSETSPCVQRIEERGLRTMMKVAISSICNFPPFSVVRVRAFVSIYVYVFVCVFFCLWQSLLMKFCSHTRQCHLCRSLGSPFFYAMSFCWLFRWRASRKKQGYQAKKHLRLPVLWIPYAQSDLIRN